MTVTMRRSTSRRHKTRCLCCPCCRQWRSTDELLAREVIRSDADALPCRKFCVCACCACCFDRRCVKASYIIFSLVLIGAILTCIVGVITILPSKRPHGFITVNCTTVSSLYPGTFFRCGKSLCDGATVCNKYPCLVVKVTLGGSNGTSSLFDTQEELLARGEHAVCSVQPKKCDISSTPEEDVKRFERQYGVIGATFPCLLSPDDSSDVIIRHEAETPFYSVLLLLVASVLMVGGLVGLLVTAFTCGCHCKVLCSGSPPFVIREKAAVHVANPYIISTGIAMRSESIT